MKKFLVITTINKPNETINKYIEILDNEWKIIIVWDRKWPTWYEDFNKKIIFLSIEKQIELYPDFSVLLPENHYCRKNIWYLHAINLWADYIAETDDDNTPYNFYPNFIEKKELVCDIINSKNPVNIYKVFTDKNIWPRWLPLTSIKNIWEIKNNTTIRPYIQQWLADNDPDVDAIYRLTDYENIKFASNRSIALSSNTFCPINTQNTFWHKEAFPLLLIPTTVHSRICDIWKWYIAQKWLWSINWNIIFLSPSVFQDRNEHNLQSDFNSEVPLYTDSIKIIKELKNIELQKNNLLKNIQTIYEKLHEQGFLQENDLNIVKIWLKYFNKK